MKIKNESFHGTDGELASPLYRDEKTSIDPELLVAYAENNVSESERQTVRQYLVEHPEELESVMITMDEDLELNLTIDAEPENQAPAADEDSHHNILHSVAAFAPQVLLGGAAAICGAAAAFCIAPAADKKKPQKQSSTDHSKLTNSGSFRQRLDDLLDELDL